MSGTHTRNPTFYREHILSRTHSIENTFYPERPDVDLFDGTLERTHSIENTFYREHILPGETRRRFVWWHTRCPANCRGTHCRRPLARSCSPCSPIENTFCYREHILHCRRPLARSCSPCSPGENTHTFVHMIQTHTPLYIRTFVHT